LRNRMTDAEMKLWYHLRLDQLRGARFRRQVPLGPYIVDFVCHKARLVIEVDGGQHASSHTDQTRTDWLESHGYRVLRFWNNDVLAETEAVVQKIADELDRIKNLSGVPANSGSFHPLPDPPHKGEGIC